MKRTDLKTLDERYKNPYPIVNSVNEIDCSSTYSYAHYLRWRFEERMEIIKGKVYALGAAPSPLHQHILVSLVSEIHLFLKHKTCKVFPAPFDVRLAGKSIRDKDVFTVVQPDITVICEPGLIDGRGCIGAPDIVVEIWSPGNRMKELLLKFELYQEHQIKEYWIVYPEQRSLTKYILTPDGQYADGEIYQDNTFLSSAILPGFALPVGEIFGDLREETPNK
jgi:Uma2 family endonuclease